MGERCVIVAESGLREEIPVSQIAREVSGALERLARVRGVAGMSLCPSGREQRFAQPPAVGRLVLLDGFGRQRSEAHRVLECRAIQRPPRRGSEVRDRLLRIGGRQRLMIVIRQFDDDRVGIAAATALDRFGDVAMNQRAARRVQAFVRDFAEERVRECVGAKAAGLPDRVRRDCLVEQRGGGGAICVRCAGEIIEPKLVPDHGGDAQQFTAAGAQPREPLFHHVADSGCKWQSKRLPSRGEAVSLRDQQPHDLADEERVAASLVVNRLDELTRCRRLGGDLDEARHIRNRQAVKGHLPVGVLPPHPRQDTAQPAVMRFVAQRRDDQDAAAA